MRWLLTFALALAFATSLGACRKDGELPDPSSEDYRDAVAAFYAGLAGIQTGANRKAEEDLRRVTELAPAEPAAWANLGLLALRENRFEVAAQRLEQARTLAPKNGRIYFLLGILEQNRGRSQEAIAYLQRAVEMNPENLRAAYALTQAIERQGEAGSDAQVQELLGQMLRTQPDNLALLLEQARIAAKRSDTTTLQHSVARLAKQARDWPAQMQERLRTLEEAAAQADFRQFATQIAFLKNVLKRLPAYRVSLTSVQSPSGQEGALITHFLRLPQPHTEPAPPDTTLHFTADSLSIDGGPWQWVRPVSLTGKGAPALVVANGQTVKLSTGAAFPFPGGLSATPPSRDGIAGLDYDNDYHVDLALAGAGGVRLIRQESAGAFTDVTAQMKLPAEIRDASYRSVWAADLDLEGDLDLVLASAEGAPRVLRNNGDGTFAAWPLFEEVTGLQDFTWADLDADGDPDATLLDAAGQLHVFSNQRAGQFLPFEGLQQVKAVRAVTVADLDSDSQMELLALQPDGAVQRFSAQEQEDGWDQAAVARWTDRPDSTEPASLFTADLDNNGELDLLAATPAEAQIWLSGEGQLHPLAASPGPRIAAVADFSGEGQLDLIGLSEDGQLVQRTSQGAKNYSSKSIQLQAARTRGDQRINSFGIGGTVEIRSGLLYQKQRVTSPTVHFGLGDHETVDVARIIWPNGTVQAEFDLRTDQTVLARQRLKGSCPWIYTHDGDDMRFVTDFLWRTALGLQINAQGDAQVIHSEDWIKIAGDELAPRDRFYDIRITGELWETHFFDHVSLMAVDHPAGTEVFVDERFVVPPARPPMHTVGPLQPVAEARDHEGRDVTAMIRNRDERYLDTFALGPFQGVAEEHFVEIELGEDVPTDGPLWLVADGWVYPTDSSINIAITQGDTPSPRSLQLEVPDGKGGWTVASANLGFPAGKKKTMLIDLSDAFQPGSPRRVRLRTNIEVYWDRLAWAEGRPDAPTERHRLDAERADLRYRGFSAIRQKSRHAPEIPIYDSLAATTPIWRDLVGYYTRFGDVRELIKQTDDRYVIMNAGDEMVLKFPVPPPPPVGWMRDFVLIGDGWVKDGDYNTGYSTTVRPLPYHGLTDYSKPPGRLEEDPAYRRHPEDWQTYHTRYVTPEPFERALTITRGEKRE